MTNIHSQPFEDIHPKPSKDMLDEFYTVIACFKRMQKEYKINIMDTSSAFFKKEFGPYLLNKRTRTDEDIREAVKLWCSDPAAAEEKYGHISKWDVSRVTNMSELFYKYWLFNEDISRWTCQR